MNQENRFPSIVQSLGTGGLPKLTIQTAWSTAEIYLLGAHLTQFQKHGEAPLIFTSSSSLFQPGTPIRGGIPLVFPWFGPRDGLPAHGYARTTEWELISTEVTQEGTVQVRLRLPSEHALKAELLIHVAAELHLDLTITNAGGVPASFENCLHTYFQIGHIDSVTIHGLQGVTYLDKLLQENFLESAQSITITGEIDRVYQDTPATVEIHDRSLGRCIRIRKSGSLSTVVWNPWIAKSQRMADFGDEDYLQMLCVESGNIAPNQITLAPGSAATLKVEISSAL